MREPSSSKGSLTLACQTELDSPIAPSAVQDVTATVQKALAAPTDFPALADAVVPGDHVVLAIDPTIPQLGPVIAGVMKALSQTEAGQIDAVLWDEATETEMSTVGQEMGPSSKVVRHQGDRREDVRYLAADQVADPIYVNRLLVDADLVIPIGIARPDFQKADDNDSHHDVTGIYPMLVDSASRMRFQNLPAMDVPASQPAWLLGVQFMLAIFPGWDDQIQDVIAGTLGSVHRQIDNRSDSMVPSGGQADLIVAVVESGTSQTWHTAVRALEAAAAMASEDATIVLWTDTTEAIPCAVPSSFFPADELDADELDADELDGDMESQLESDSENETVDAGDADPQDSQTETAADAADQDFPAWNSDRMLAAKLSEIGSHFRILIRSCSDPEAIELAGFGSIDNTEELTRLSRGFDTGCVLRRASFLVPAAVEMTAFNGLSGSRGPQR